MVSDCMGIKMNIIQFRLYSFFSPDDFKRNPNIFVGPQGVVGSTVLMDDWPWPLLRLYTTERDFGECPVGHCEHPLWALAVALVVSRYSWGENQVLTGSSWAERPLGVCRPLWMWPHYREWWVGQRIPTIPAVAQTVQVMVVPLSWLT